MRRAAVALFVALGVSVRFASAAAISVAGAECGSPPLLGLTLSVPAGGSNIDGTACPDGSFGAILGDSGPLYGSPIQTIVFSVSDPSQLGNIDSLPGSAFKAV